MDDSVEEHQSSRPFRGKVVYFAGSIRGAERKDPDLFWKLIEYMKQNGADVVDDFVGARTKRERDEIFLKRTGLYVKRLKHPWISIRKISIELVDKSNYMIAEITSPSFGLGMELQRALDKPQLGLNKTKILGLYNKDVVKFENISWNVIGASSIQNNNFTIVGYSEFEDAKKAIFDFLTEG